MSFQPLFKDCIINLLCVDDDSFLLRLLPLALKPYGINVLTAENGREALTLFKESSLAIDAVLSDTDMPDLGGPGLTKELRQLGFSGPILVMSGRSLEASQLAYAGLKISGILHKPFSLGQIVTLLFAALKRKRLEAVPSLENQESSSAC